MTKTEMEAKLNELVNNQQFTAKIEACGSIDETIALFAQEGIEVDAEKLCAAMKDKGLAFVNGKMEFSGELTEEILENVSGGIVTLCGILFGSICVACGCQLYLNFFG